MGGIHFVPFVSSAHLLEACANSLTPGEWDVRVLAAPHEQGLRPEFIHARETVIRFPGAQRPGMDIGRIETRRCRDIPPWWRGARCTRHCEKARRDQAWRRCRKRPWSWSS